MNKKSQTRTLDGMNEFSKIFWKVYVGWGRRAERTCLMVCIEVCDDWVNLIDRLFVIVSFLALAHWSLCWCAIKHVTNSNKACIGTRVIHVLFLQPYVFLFNQYFCFITNLLIIVHLLYMNASKSQLFRARGLMISSTYCLRDMCTCIFLWFIFISMFALTGFYKNFAHWLLSMKVSNNKKLTSVTAARWLMLVVLVRLSQDVMINTSRW